MSSVNDDAAAAEQCCEDLVSVDCQPGDADNLLASLHDEGFRVADFRLVHAPNSSLCTIRLQEVGVL